MRIAVLQSHEIPALRRFAEAHLTSSMFLLGNLLANGFEDRGKPRHGTYAAAWDDGAVVGAAVHYRRGNLTVNAPHHAEAVCRTAVRASGRDVLGINGPEAHVDQVHQAFGLPTDADAIQVDEREGLFRLPLSALQRPAALTNGEVQGRALESRDVDRVTAMTVAYRVESVGERETDALWSVVRAGVRASVAAGDTWVLERQGEVVARSGFNAQTPGAVQLGSVFTPPELRGRGYGRCVVASHLQAARERGVELGVLFTGDDNTPARRAYEALGFEEVGRYRVVMLHRAHPIG